MTIRRAAFGLALTAAIAVTGALITPVAHAAPADDWEQQRVDFNNDGYQDAVVGAPAGTVTGHKGAGYVTVVYGASGGTNSGSLNPTAHAVISQKTAGIPGTPEDGDAFGASTVALDLNGDPYTDLVIGIPGEDIGTAANSGAATILWGSQQGLVKATSLAAEEIPGAALGTKLVTGDFTGDGKPELAAFDSTDGARVYSGIGQDGSVAHESALGLPYEQWGSVFAKDLAAGDVTGDGVDDLVVIVQDTDEPDSLRAGLLRGSADGLVFAGTLKGPGGGRFGGEHVAVGDLNGDGYADVVIGHAFDGYDSDIDLPTKGGALAVAYGGPGGQSTTVKPVWINQDTPGVPGVGEYGDYMGLSLAVGDINNDGYGDVVTGVPYETVDGVTAAGSVLVLKGSASGLTGTGAKVFSQATTGVPGVIEKNDRFGRTVTLVGAFRGHNAEVVVGDPDENAGNGAVWVVRSNSGGPNPSNTISFSPGTVGAPASAARFGASLSHR
jgi:hypothetical protein